MPGEHREDTHVSCASTPGPVPGGPGSTPFVRTTGETRMTQRATDNSHSSEHAEVWEMLPWYVNGTLSDHERASVEAHLVTCAACQAELARCHDLAAAVRVAAADGWEPSAEHFARVLARLDATTAAATPQRGWWDTVRAQYERYADMLRRTPPL